MLVFCNWRIGAERHTEEVLTHRPLRLLKCQLGPLLSDSASSGQGWLGTLLLELL